MTKNWAILPILAVLGLALIHCRVSPQSTVRPLSVSGSLTMAMLAIPAATETTVNL